MPSGGDDSQVERCIWNSEESLDWEIILAICLLKMIFSFTIVVAVSMERIKSWKTKEPQSKARHPLCQEHKPAKETKKQEEDQQSVGVTEAKERVFKDGYPPLQLIKSLCIGNLVHQFLLSVK